MMTGLAAILKRLGIHQVELAKSLGVRQESVSRWVHGREAKGASLLAVLHELQKYDPEITVEDLTGRKRRRSLSSQQAPSA